MVITLAGVELQPVASSTDADCHRFEYDRDTTAASMAVIAALSEVSETDPLALQPLQSTIDGDALDALLSEREAESDDIEITLQIETYTVTVYGDGEIAVSPSTVGRPIGPSPSEI